MCVCWLLWKQLLRVHGGIHWNTMCVLKYDVLFEVLYNYQMLKYNSSVIGTTIEYYHIITSYCFYIIKNIVIWCWIFGTRALMKFFGRLFLWYFFGIPLVRRSNNKKYLKLFLNRNNELTLSAYNDANVRK